MQSRKLIPIAGICVLLAITTVSTLLAGPRRGGPPKPEDVTLVGQLVDLQTYMTEHCPGDDFARCARDNIRNGVPAALVTDDGLVVIGMADKGPARMLLPLADQEVELNGKLYDKDGLLYIDMTGIKAYKEEAEAEQPAEREGEGEGRIRRPMPTPQPRNP